MMCEIITVSLGVSVLFASSTVITQENPEQSPNAGCFDRDFAADGSSDLCALLCSACPHIYTVLCRHLLLLTVNCSGHQ